MTSNIISLLACSIVYCPCMDIIFGRFKRQKNRSASNDPDPFVSRPSDVSYLVLKHVDFFTLSRLLRREYWGHPLTDAVRPALMGRLIPAIRKIDWFDTIDGTHVFQNPLKIRRFFEVMRFLYPEFDASCAAFRMGNKAPVSPQMWRFLNALNDKARESLSYFFAADPAQHDAILHSHLHTAHSFSQLEEAMHRTIWEHYDSAAFDRTRDIEVTNPAVAEIYLVFPKKVVPKYRELLHAQIPWRMLKNFGHSKVVPVKMPRGYSRIAASFVDPFHPNGLTLGYHTGGWFLQNIYDFPPKWFVESDLQGFLPE